MLSRSRSRSPIQVELEARPGVGVFTTPTRGPGFRSSDLTLVLRSHKSVAQIHLDSSLFYTMRADHERNVPNRLSAFNDVIEKQQSHCWLLTYQLYLYYYQIQQKILSGEWSDQDQAYVDVLCRFQTYSRLDLGPRIQTYTTIDQIIERERRYIQQSSLIHTHFISIEKLLD